MDYPIIGLPRFCEDKTQLPYSSTVSKVVRSPLHHPKELFLPSTPLFPNQTSVQAKGPRAGFFCCFEVYRAAIIPKQANFDNFTDKKIASIQKKINNRPRQKPKFETPKQSSSKE